MGFPHHDPGGDRCFCGYHFRGVSGCGSLGVGGPHIPDSLRGTDGHAFQRCSFLLAAAADGPRCLFYHRRLLCAAAVYPLRAEDSAVASFTGAGSVRQRS